MRRSELLVMILFVMASLTCGGTATPTPISQVEPTAAPPQPTATVQPTEVPPTATPLPPTATPTPTVTPDPNLIRPGTYLVGTEIRPGLYHGRAGEGMLESCYWARLKDTSGSLDSILANDNAVGPFYVQILDGDYALKTDCELRYLPALPSPPGKFPTEIGPGTYLVNIDIRPGKYQGQAGADILDSCYWARLSGLSGSMGEIIANENATGQFYVDVLPGDFAFTTRCLLKWIAE